MQIPHSQVLGTQHWTPGHAPHLPSPGQVKKAKPRDRHLGEPRPLPSLGSWWHSWGSVLQPHPPPLQGGRPPLQMRPCGGRGPSPSQGSWPKARGF